MVGVLLVSKPDTPTGASWPPVTARPSLSSSSYTCPHVLPTPKRTTFREGVSVISSIRSKEKSTPSSMPAVPGCDVYPLPRTANCQPNVSMILTPIATCSVLSGTKTVEALRRAREPLSKELERPYALAWYALSMTPTNNVQQKQGTRGVMAAEYYLGTAHSAVPPYNSRSIALDCEFATLDPATTPH